MRRRCWRRGCGPVINKRRLQHIVAKYYISEISAGRRAQSLAHFSIAQRARYHHLLLIKRQSLILATHMAIAYDAIINIIADSRKWRKDSSLRYERKLGTFTRFIVHSLISASFQRSSNDAPVAAAARRRYELAARIDDGENASTYAACFALIASSRGALGWLLTSARIIASLGKRRLEEP